MAKKKKSENTLSYLQMPLPEGGKYSKMTKVSFGGLNKRYTLDSGELTMESNISTKEYPYLTPSEQRKEAYKGYADRVVLNDVEKHPISMFAFDNFLVVVYYISYVDDYAEKQEIRVDYITEDNVIHTGILENDSDKASATVDTQRSIVQFNVYDTPTDPVTGKYVKKLLFFPDKYSMYMNIVKADSDPAGWEYAYTNAKEAEKLNTALAKADLGVMYYYGDGDNRRYYTVIVVEDTNDNDENRVTYKRIVQNKFDINSPGYFLLDGMVPDIKSYYNDTPEIDASGAIIYPPPDTASHNCYYKNTYNHADTGYGTDIYKWCEYDALKREDEWGLEKDKDGNLLKDAKGNYIPYGFVKDEAKNYVPDGTTHGWKVSLPPTVPDIKYATVHLSRVFGVDDDRVYASGYNNYANWNLDTIDEYNEANSWCSPSQSNTKAGGSFTGITTFDSHVICFKRDFMHEIYNTKNPFRLQDIYAEGAIDNRTIQNVDGKLIFVSEDDVKIYTGSNPRIIGYKLNMPNYTYAVSGTDNRNYYLYCESEKSGTDKYQYLYVYDTFTEMWSEQSIEKRVLSFAHNKNGMYMFCEDGIVYQMDTGFYNHEWSCETDLITNKTVDIKHIKKIQMLVDIDGDSAIDVGMQVYILYDDEDFDELENKASRLVYTSTKTGRFPIRVKPRNTANYGFKLHFEGKGYVKLYELEIFVEQGGALYV